LRAALHGAASNVAIDEAFSSLSHLLAAPLALAWGLHVKARRRDRPDLGPLLLFFGAATLLLAVSGTYHMLAMGSASRALFLRFDHVAIWIMIASSFHAVHAVAFEDRWRWFPTLLVWLLAAVGIALTVLVFDAFSRMTWVVMYVLVGWTGLASILRLVAQGRNDAAISFGIGGAVYTIAALAEEIFPYDPVYGVMGPHQVFHLAVLGGLAIHGALLVRMFDQSPVLQRGSSAPQRIRTWICVSWPSLWRTIGSAPDQFGQRTSSCSRSRVTPKIRAAV
jgi:channel protein (hemolysin III family)